MAVEGPSALAATVGAILAKHCHDSGWGPSVPLFTTVGVQAISNPAPLPPTWHLVSSAGGGGVGLIEQCADDCCQLPGLSAVGPLALNVAWRWHKVVGKGQIGVVTSSCIDADGFKCEQSSQNSVSHGCCPGCSWVPPGCFRKGASRKCMSPSSHG